MKTNVKEHYRHWWTKYETKKLLLFLNGLKRTQQTFNKPKSEMHYDCYIVCLLNTFRDKGMDVLENRMKTWPPLNFSESCLSHSSKMFSGVFFVTTALDQ